MNWRTRWTINGAHNDPSRLKLSLQSCVAKRFTGPKANQCPLSGRVTLQSESSRNESLRRTWTSSGRLLTLSAYPYVR